MMSNDKFRASNSLTLTLTKMEPLIITNPNLGGTTRPAGLVLRITNPLSKGREPTEGWL